MAEHRRLSGKRILVVDDEPDILETLVELLYKCDVTTASSFEEAKGILETKKLDVAILDIMGVDGYRLLDIANQKEVLAIMLTAHSLNPESTAKAYKKGAAFFVPKEKMVDMITFLEDVLEAKEMGANYWTSWLDRFETYYDKIFGPDWKDSDKDFWDELAKLDWRLTSTLRRKEHKD
jgi:DNA-binding NtrC family response regulator